MAYLWLTDGVYTAGEDEERRVHTVDIFISSQSFLEVSSVSFAEVFLSKNAYDAFIYELYSVYLKFKKKITGINVWLWSVGR